MVERVTQVPGPSIGNGSALLLVDSRLAEYMLVHQTVLSAFAHFRIPYRLRDLAEGPLSAEELEESAVIVIAQENFGLRATAGDLSKLLTATAAGVGLVNLDARLDRYAKEFVEALLGKVGLLQSYAVTEVRVPDTDHFITYTQSPGAVHRTLLPVPGIRFESAPSGWTTIAQTNDGPAVLATRHKQGRIVQWLISPQLWTQQFFGLAHGLDDILWKGVVWAARKPFAMMPLPPFVRFRIDDCNGLYKGAADLAFVDVFNRHGHKPNLSVCLSALQSDGWAELKRLQDGGNVEVAPHVWSPAISLFFGDKNGEYSEQRLKQIITETKQLFEKNGITPSVVLSDHVHEYSKRVLPLLGELGIEFKMNVTAPGEAWDGKHLDWNPAPYGSMSYVIDYIPGPYPLFVVFNHYPAFDFIRVRIDRSHWVVNRGGGVGSHKWDFLNGLTKSAQGKNDIEAIAQRLAEHTRLGLNSLFFGGSITHSHFTVDLSNQEWEAVLDRYEVLTARLPQINVGYDDLAYYVRSRHHVFIEQTQIKGAGGSVRLIGDADVPLKLTVYQEHGDALEARQVDIPIFSGAHTVIY